MISLFTSCIEEEVIEPKCYCGNILAARRTQISYDFIVQNECSSRIMTISEYDMIEGRVIFGKVLRNEVVYYCSKIKQPW